MITVTSADKRLLGEHYKRPITIKIPRVNIHCYNLDNKNKKFVTIVYISCSYITSVIFYILY